ncbi:hypothetical protein F2Q68_00041155 [Brassica cretica]|uniref:Uncharacterized protein n=1 Tax=Brassica cretica TaxID=69181 RepID=A0A8S9MIT4_BRACR|nr:hypothetical protein F2Q68_00041155 [Brassica cretica]
MKLLLPAATDYKKYRPYLDRKFLLALVVWVLVTRVKPRVTPPWVTSLTATGGDSRAGIGLPGLELLRSWDLEFNRRRKRSFPVFFPSPLNLFALIY